ncbi:anti-sigma factor family protein [Marivirga arenosa]|uniref:Uncharacterized protein n=1 Tax=Marivirga arenosa TaxID=3059076 RepID=A0AA49GGW9_9BACT|nr:hypothetical protein [Marivirga sp. BKB1-2]WKK81447.1 hypothetical protein QYS47_03815 [Marivirga sp. BKB1-2]
MKTEDWKAMIMDYLYDELGPKDKTAFENELSQNPDLKEELEAFQSTQNIMGSWEDEKVSAPPFFNVYKTEPPKNSQNGYKWFISIAASFLILMLAAKFTGLEISSQDNDFRIAFNQNSTDQNQLNQQEVQKMMGQVLANYEQKLEEKRVEDKQELKSYLAKQSNQNKAIIDNYLTSLQQNNLQLMETYWKESNEQQQVYTEQLLSDFAEYVQEQRQEDMDYLFAKMELMESDKDLFKIETGQMINALASNQSAEEAY